MTALGIRDRWIAWRNRRLTDPRFQTWAAGFPLTRGVARRRARDLFDLVAGFVYSQTLVACIRLGVFERLRSGPLDTAGMTRSLDLDPDTAERLLGAAAALQLVERLPGDRWALGPQGAALLGAPGLIDMIGHHDRLYADLADSAALFRSGGGGGRLAAYWPYAGDAGPAAVGAYSALMAATQPAVAADVIASYPFARHKRLLDVGGGEGAFIRAVATAAPRLSIGLFDLPAVVERARQRLGEQGLSDRTEFASGDFFHDPLPRGADLISLIRILHDHDDAEVMKLLKGVRAALPPDGVLLIAEPMSAAPRPDRVADVYFAVYLLAMGSGRARTPDLYAQMLRQAGFSRVKPLATRNPLLLRAITARP